jgi:MraZ protein
MVMALFLSTIEKQIDKKGRVSVPPTFRAVLAAQNFNGMIAYASFTNPCIEACGMERIEKLHARIEALDPFSEEHDAFATAILGGSTQLAFDGEGRVVIPEGLLKKAGITDTGIFVGKGATFEIWSPELFASQEARMRELALAKRLSLKADGGAQ